MKTKSVSISAPLGGWNARDAWGDMKPTDAVAMTNWFPGTSDVFVRNGYTQQSTGLDSQVESLLVYSGGSSNKLFGVSAGGKIYDCSAGGAVGAASVTGLSNGRFESVNIATSGGNFLLAVNAADKLRGYNGTSWWTDGDGAHDITGFNTSTASNITLFKNRIWFIQSGTLNAWYLPTSAIAGAASQFPLQSVAREGGSLVAMAAWTIDAGYGVDDLLAFVTSKGEIIVYKGTDPASANTWALVGVWKLGSPIGNRCMMKYAGDLLIITQDGLVPMSSALQSSRLNPKVAVSNKIQWATSQAITTYGSNFGWDLCYFPKANFLVLNVPVNTGSGQEQYVMNTITQSWCRFTGWNANCWEIFNDNLYFGGNTFVGQAWNGFSDNGASIQADCAQAFSYFGIEGIQKHFTMARPMLLTNDDPSILCQMNVDFAISGNYAPLSIISTTYGTWDHATWDVSVWGAGLTLSRQWQGITGVGYAGGIELQVAANGIETHWVSTDIVFELGDIL